ncbi:MAG: hypothetical protein PUB18_04770 [bacterium]|nr:hypothetical protein [bacterium]
MKNASLLTILLEFFTAIFAIILIPLFELKLPTDMTTYIILLAISIIYAITDRLNIEARYGLDPSIFSMLKQMSTVFIIILSVIFMKEKVVLTKIIGATIIIIANLLLTWDKNKLKMNKYFIMSLVSNFLFAILMIININISSKFNIAFYTFLTACIPSLVIKTMGRYKWKDVKKEFNLYNKRLCLLSAFFWCIMLNSSIKAYELGNIIIVASLFALTPLFNSLVEFIWNKNKKELLKKVIVSILVLIGVIMIKSNS